ncbi:hypothetical protein SAMN05421878_1132 [Actinobaculum suis]|uniref:Uncharacterized protein n=1 Tax=Actinobaculum suis TaxID=1657 RepID=A0A1G7DTJ3_9ACTO|nr:hypothetical protein SAMN05421878_1132 [Actinobaculum suis]VDG77216.1 Uncharacterised protein [Actinobaculum suis]
MTEKHDRKRRPLRWKSAFLGLGIEVVLIFSLTWIYAKLRDISYIYVLKFYGPLLGVLALVGFIVVLFDIKSLRKWV